MSETARYIETVQMLLDQTRKGNVNWRTSDDWYADVEVGQFTVSLSTATGNGVLLGIFEQAGGKTVDQVVFSPDTAGYDVAKQLFDAVRTRPATPDEVDDAIQQIQRALSGRSLAGSA